MSKLSRLLQENEVMWLEKIQMPPYNIKVSNERGLYIFKYNQIASDFSRDLVRECRGIILDRNDNWKVVCRAFDKFGNFGESYVPKLNWEKTTILEKLDGSLIKIWKYKGNMVISTNGTIDANNADTPLSFETEEGFFIKSFYDLVFYTFKKMWGEDWKAKLDSFFDFMEEGLTHIFELCTPFNRVVVPHKDCKLYYLGSRDCETGKEFEERELEDYFPRPHSLYADTLDQVIELCKTLPFDEEGYVAYDNRHQRIKIKSPAYLAVHHLRGEGTPSSRRLLDLIRSNEGDEFLNYFPEYSAIYKRMTHDYKNFLARIQAQIGIFNFWREDHPEASRKDMALFITKNCSIPSLVFQYLDGKFDSMEDIEDWVKDESSEKILKWVERKNDTI